MYTRFDVISPNMSIDIEVNDLLTGPRGHAIIDIRTSGDVLQLYMTKQQVEWFRNELSKYLGDPVE